jgi:hypothetical protein
LSLPVTAMHCAVCCAVLCCAVLCCAVLCCALLQVTCFSNLPDWRHLGLVLSECAASAAGLSLQVLHATAVLSSARCCQHPYLRADHMPRPVRLLTVLSSSSVVLMQQSLLLLSFCCCVLQAPASRPSSKTAATSQSTRSGSRGQRPQPHASSCRAASWPSWTPRLSWTGCLGICSTHCPSIQQYGLRGWAQPATTPRTTQQLRISATLPATPLATVAACSRRCRLGRSRPHPQKPPCAGRAGLWSRLGCCGGPTPSRSSGRCTTSCGGNSMCQRAPRTCVGV